MNSPIKKIAIIGTGVIGAGWTIRLLAKNKVVNVYDPNISQLNFLKLFAKKLALKIVDFETNGLDLQTIIGPTNNKKTKKILLLQNAIDELKISDHFRVAFKKL